MTAALTSSLKHELAYVLGQTKNLHAIPTLRKVLANLDEEPMVRHEAAEALGAIGDPSCLGILNAYLTDPNETVRKTCELAISKINFEAMQNDEHIPSSIYTSIDPAPPSTKTKSTEELKAHLLNTSLPLFERYRAMFALRNIGDTEAVLALAEGLKDNSALFRHEIAYVFGQMQHPASVPSLIKTLTKSHEVNMVRHEAAEALGSIATPEIFPILDKYCRDSEPVVRESCIVALDMYEYETGNQFQYADGLSKVVDGEVAKATMHSLRLTQ